MSDSGERAVAGVTSGLIGLGQRVTWVARHLGLRWSLTSEIVAFDRPRRFRDSMVDGPFARFDHDHELEERHFGTAMRDVFDYTAPLGPLGRLAERLFLSAYLRRILTERCQEIRAVAESDRWRQYLPTNGAVGSRLSDPYGSERSGEER